MSQRDHDFWEGFHRHLCRNPNRAVALGVSLHLDELPDPTVYEQQRLVAEARALLDELSAIDRTGLDFDGALDHELAKLRLESEIGFETIEFNGHTELEQLPSAGDDIGNGIFLLMMADPRPLHERLADVNQRIEQVPRYLADLLGRLSTPLERWVGIDVEKVSGLPVLFATVVEAAEQSDWPDSTSLKRAAKLAEQALDEYTQALSQLPTTTSFSIGPSAAQRLVALRGIELDMATLHRMAADFLKETSEFIEELRRRLVDKYSLAPETTAAELEHFLCRRFPAQTESTELDSIVDRYQAEQDRIVAFIEERDLFPLPPNQRLTILRTPKFMEPSIPAGAMLSPAPFRAGVKQSLVYLTLSEELLDEHTELSIPSMMIHEGIPGHHLQLATAAMHASLARRHSEAMDQAEGWTTLLEDYMLDAGYMGNLLDEARFVGKRDLCRLAARVAIDLFFLTGQRGYLDIGVPLPTEAADPFAQAGALLSAVTGFVPGRVRAELNWYSQERAYPLCYLTGNRLAWQLKRDVERGPAGRSPAGADRAFFKAYLGAGNMPLSYLRRVFLNLGLVNPAEAGFPRAES